MYKRIKAAMMAGLILFCVAAALYGCGKKEEPSSNSKDLTDEYRDTSAEDREPPPAGPAEDFQIAYLDFSVRLLKESMEEGKNTMVSPLSVMTALAMTENGAEGETKEQMDAVLFPGITAEDGAKGLKAWSAGLPDKEAAHFSMANSIWYRDSGGSFQAEEDFLKKNKKEYQAEIFSAPFGPETLSDINRWVKQGTDGRIEQILDRIDPDAVMYLINAVAFDAEWKKIYRPHQVKEGAFYLSDGSETAVAMMYSREAAFLKGEHAKGFLKPYRDGYSFAAILPDEGITPEDYLAGISGEELFTMLNGAEETVVASGLPQFEAETSLDLKTALSNLGMPLAFDGDRADFTGMGSSKDGNIAISRVIHKTCIQVDAVGTKASASTSVEMVDEGAMADTEIVILNRPFLYAVVDQDSKLPVFIGIADHLGK